MADDFSRSAQLNYSPLPNEQDVKIKDALLNPTRRDNSNYFLELTKDVRLGNIPREDREWWSTYLRMTKELVNLYHMNDLSELAQMRWSEFMEEWNATASDEGFQIKHLGQTTGNMRTEVKGLEEKK